MATFRFPLLIVCAAAVWGATALHPARQAPQESAREQAYRSNNVGVAQLEQYSYDEAAQSFRGALSRDQQLDIARVNLALALFYAGQEEEAAAAARAAIERLPNVPQAHYVSGLIARAQGRLDDAIAAFRRVLELDPSDTGSRVNLGQILVQQRQYPGAIQLFKEALAGEPFNVTAAYGLATAATRSGEPGGGREEMKRFEALRDSAYGVTYAQRYLEQGRYGEAVASTGAEPDLVSAGPPPVSFVDATDAMFGAAARASSAQPSASPDGSISLFDADGDGDLDLLATATSQGSQRFLINERGAFADGAAKAGLAPAAVAAAGALAADYDNDGRADILLLRADGLRLFHQREDRSFEDVTARAGIRADAGAVRTAAFADVDHDGDLDIFAGRLLRNNGNGSFSDITSALGVAERAVDAVAVAPTDYDNRRDIDLLILARAGLPRLFQNMRDGTFRDVAQTAGLPGIAQYSALASGDVNKDGYQDFFFGRTDAPGVMVLSDGRGRFTTTPAPDGAAGVIAASFVDYDNDGLLDVFTAAKRGLRLFRNLGGRWSDMTDASQVAIGRREARRRRAGGHVRRSRSRWRPRRGGDPRQRRAPRLAERRRQPEPFAARGDEGPGQQSSGCGIEGRPAGRKPAAADRDVRGNALGGSGRRPLRAGAAVRGRRRARHLAVGHDPGGDDRRCAHPDDRRAGSQAVIVPVPLHVEWLAVRVHHRFHGRRGNRLLAGPRALEHTGS